LHKALLAPIAFAKPKKGELPRPVYMAMGSERAADEVAREAIAEGLANASVQDPQAITLATVDASVEVRGRMDEMHAKAQQAQQDNGIIIPAGTSEVDASMHAISLLRESAVQRARDRDQQLKVLKAARTARERSIKANSQGQHSAINPNPRSRWLAYITNAFGTGPFTELVTAARVHADTYAMPESKTLKHKDFVTWCIFAVGSLLKFRTETLSGGQLLTNDLRQLLLEQDTHDNMRDCVNREAEAKSYATKIMSGWRALQTVLLDMPSPQAAAAQAGSSGAGSSNALLLLMPPSDSEGAATEPPVSPFDNVVDAE